MPTPLTKQQLIDAADKAEAARKKNPSPRELAIQQRSLKRFLELNPSVGEFRKLRAVSEGLFRIPKPEEIPSYDRRLLGAVLKSVDPEAKVSEIGAETAMKGRATRLAETYNALNESGVNSLSPSEREGYRKQLRGVYEEVWNKAAKELSAVSEGVLAGRPLEVPLEVYESEFVSDFSDAEAARETAKRKVMLPDRLRLGTETAKKIERIKDMSDMFGSQDPGEVARLGHLLKEGFWEPPKK